MKTTLSLDGTWQVIIDHDNKGRYLKWQRADNFHRHHDIESIAVPACLEEFRQDYEGAAWYGKSFAVPGSWAGKTIRLRFEAVNYRAEIWVNGEATGAHEGGYAGFELPIDDLLNEGENFLAVRVITPHITRDVVIDGLGRDDMPHWRGAIAGGIWQSVSLIATGPVFVEDTFVTTDIATGEVTIANQLQNRLLRIQAAELAWSITPWRGGAPVASGGETVNLNPGGNSCETRLTVDGHRLWQLQDPALYVLRTEVRLQDERSDREETRVGFREFTASDKHFLLNREKIVLKTVFNEAFYPHSLAYPRDLDLLHREFELIKEGNINMIRPWRKPQPKIVYDLADERGVLFVGALPVECMSNWPQITPYTKQRIENEAVEMVRRDRNHPSIVIWEMFNEIMRDGLKRLKHSVSLKARALDTTRLIIDEAGGFADGCSVYLPGSYEPTTINDVHNYPGSPLAQEAYDNLLALGKSEEQLRQSGQQPARFTRSNIQPGLLTNISELGYGSIPDLEANMAKYRKEGNPITPDYRIHERLHDSYLSVFHETGSDQVFPDFHAFVEACQEVHYTGNKLMAEACRINPDIAGIGIHALNDGDWVVGAGLIDNFRNPKKPYYAIQEVFADRYLAIRPGEQNVYAGQQVPVLLTSVNDRNAVSGTLSMKAIASNGKTVLEVEEQVDLPAGITDLKTYDVDTGGLEGPCRITVLFTAGDGTTVSNESSIYVLDREKSALPDTDALPALIDMDGVLGRYLSHEAEFSPQTPLEQAVFVNLNGWTGEPDTRFRALAAWVESGGKAVFLNLPAAEIFTRDARESALFRKVEKDGVLPFSLSLYTGQGLWTPCSHVVRDHPIFEGLPSQCLMGQEYRNVVPRWSIVKPASNWIAGNLTYDWHAGLNHRQNYLGVTAAFHGADLTILPHSKGSYLLSTLRIVENLGRDPVADRILRNLIRHG